MKNILWLLALLSAASGCTLMVGKNEVGHLAPRGSYRSVDTSGQEAEGWQDTAGGGKVDPTTTIK